MTERLSKENAFIERSLGESIICGDCKATLKTYADACTAGLSDACPGFMAIEQAKDKARLERHPDRGHIGACGPEAGCDALCMDLAHQGAANPVRHETNEE